MKRQRRPVFSESQLRYIALDAWEHSGVCTDRRDARSWWSIAKKANAMMKQPALRLEPKR